MTGVQTCALPIFIKRLPIDLDYVRENAMNLAPEDVLTQAQEALQADLDSRIAEMTIFQASVPP